jgi:hypothetical protein
MTRHPARVARACERRMGHVFFRARVRPGARVDAMAALFRSRSFFGLGNSVFLAAGLLLHAYPPGEFVLAPSLRAAFAAVAPDLMCVGSALAAAAVCLPCLPLVPVCFH